MRSAPEDWARRTLGDLGTLHGGSTPRRDVARFWGGEIPWVTPGELTALGEKYLHETAECITEAGLASCGASLLPTDSILVTTRATLGHVVLAGRPTSTNQGFRSIVLSAGDDPSFLYHLMPILKREMIRRASGTTFLEISGREFAAIEICTPEPAEQRRVSEILDTIDEAIRKTEQVIAKLQHMKQGLLHDLLTRGIDESGELRDPERNPEHFKDSALGRVPEDWRVDELGKHVQLLSGCAFPSSGFHESEGLPLVRIRDLERNKTEVMFRGAFDPRYLLSRGDILIGMDGDFHVRRWTGGSALLNQRVCRITAIAPALIDDFLRFLLPPHIDAIHRITPQTTVRHLSTKAIQGCLVALPKPPEQRRIADALGAHRARERTEFEAARRLRFVKQGLMDDLLTGRVRVRSPEEPGA